MNLHKQIRTRLAPLGLIVSLAALPCVSQRPKRTVVPLNGIWQISESTDADAMPTSYTHTVPVPGLVHSATPAFANVDEYQTRQLLSNLVSQKRLPQSAFDKLGDVRGITTQPRNYFWYRRSFAAPALSRAAFLRVNKAQFGMTVWVNGKKIGSHEPCFTSATFDVTDAIRWQAQNEVVIRIGAHPGVLPKNVSEGTDFEKNRWTPGIYDDVTLFAADGPVIETVQAAPNIHDGTVTLQTVVRNVTSTRVVTTLRQTVLHRDSRAPVGVEVLPISLAAHEERTYLQRVKVPAAHLWSPEDPHLYEAVTETPGDQIKTRFGMREFRFDTATRRAYLNGHPYFMRGSNITLHRFFEDPESGTLPWDDAWVHKLLVDIPKRMHWNSFRFCIGPVPDRWLEIADENGLLIENEYFVWTSNAVQRKVIPDYNKEEMITEYTEWMRDNWNHPSVVIWDATNESFLPQFTDAIIPAVRALDLSDRPWENSYNSPAGPDDPVEDHQYLFHQKDFKPQSLEQMMGPLPSGSTSKSAHATILNEYGWLWLNRDGSPTLLTDDLYPKLMAGKPDTAAGRFETENYFLAGETEFWRAYRHYAGVLHFVLLTASEPHAFTSDHFQNVKTLELNPGFEAAMSQAFDPLGVYLNFWQPQLKIGSSRDLTVMMVNDENRERRGTLTIELYDKTNRPVGQLKREFDIPALGAQSYMMTMQVAGVPGDAVLKAVAHPDEKDAHTVTSRRLLKLQ